MSVYIWSKHTSMAKKFTHTLLAFFTLSLVLNAIAQNSLRINPNIFLPKDSLEKSHLIQSLNDFLLLAQKPNEENTLLLETERLETFVFLDEWKNIAKSKKYNDVNFYKPYLTNVVPLKENKYLIQVSYIAVNKDTAMLRADFEFIAHKNENRFLFSSPLVQNTKNWKVEKIGNNFFHYQTSLNKTKAEEYNKLVLLYDKKLNNTNKTMDLYCCANLVELQKLVGVNYKSDYNGRYQGEWSSSLGDKKLTLFGDFDSFDPHDLWHSRLSMVVTRSKVNRPVDEGCAYLYGGSWGMTWKEIFKEFKEQIASNKNTDWLEIKENPIYFKTKEFNNSADYIVNALLVKEIESKKGFAGVWELLNIGPFEKGNETYYKTLEKLTGITKENYNSRVWELINNEI